MKRLALFVVALLLFVVIAFQGVSFVQERSQRQKLIAEQEIIEKPVVERPASRSSIATSTATSASDLRRDALNWDVPFTSQAPFGVWDELHGEACEEASVLMVIRYFAGKKFASVESADSALKHLVAANTALGFAVDDTAAEVIMLLRSEDPSLSAVLLNNPSIDDLKSVLSKGSLVIVPAAGRQLHNPYYRQPGPLYHMLVLRGYTKDGYVLTNDPGTKNGEQYAYRWEVLLNAIHDWNGGDIENGQKVVVVVSK